MPIPILYICELDSQLIRDPCVLFVLESVYEDCIDSLLHERMPSWMKANLERLLEAHLSIAVGDYHRIQCAFRVRINQENYRTTDSSHGQFYWHPPDIFHIQGPNNSWLSLMSIDKLLGVKGSSGPHNTKLNVLYLSGESSLQVCSDGFMSH